MTIAAQRERDPQQSAPDPTAPLEETGGESVRADLVRLACEQLPVSLLATVFTAGVLILVARHDESMAGVGVWLGLVMAVAVLRSVMHHAFLRASAESRARRAWERRFVAGAGLAGAAWGSGALLIFHSGHEPHQMFLLLVFGGMVAAAVVALAPLRAAYTWYASMVLLPLIGRLAFERHELVFYAIVLSAVFYAFMLVTAAKVNTAIRRSFALRHENAALVESLRVERSLQEQLNSDLSAEIAERQATEGALRASHEHLEERVRERTDELTRAVYRLEREVEERLAAQEALEASEERYRTLYEDNPSMYCALSPEGVVLTVNPFGAQHLGYDPMELVGRSAFDAAPADEHPFLRERLAGCLASPGQTMSWSTRKLCKDGRVTIVRETGRAVRRPDGSMQILIVCEDITDRDLLEQQLRQAQKMEAIGRLTGGIAHDFNNLLTVILGYSNALLAVLDSASPIREDIEAISDAGERASALTRQLLAFSRQQVAHPRVLELNHVVTDMRPMLARLTEAGVRLAIEPSQQAALMTADLGQIEQVLMNLVVNACDAMPDGGDLTIRVSHESTPAAPALSATGSEPARFVCLSVRDTGIGMDRATQERIFEPFYTTKEEGKGTGLGLSTVYGIVSQNGGEISVTSEPGAGAEFVLRFPAASASLALDAGEAPRGRLPAGSEVVLLVEDDEVVRPLTARVLTRCGYTVLEAGNAEEGLAIIAADPPDLAMVISDFAMPGMNGLAFIERAVSLRPSLKALLVSGNINVSEVRSELSSGSLPHLWKPFTPESLAQKVREVLDGAPEQMA